jgi:hypothetical protein
MAEEALARLVTVLRQWFGPYGTEALVGRALLRARLAHPALATVRVGPPPALPLAGAAAAAAAHGAPTVAAGLATIREEAVALLARMIGDDMAQQLVERSMEAPGAHLPERGAPDGAGRSA